MQLQENINGETVKRTGDWKQNTSQLYTGDPKVTIFMGFCISQELPLPRDSLQTSERHRLLRRLCEEQPCSSSPSHETRFAASSPLEFCASQIRFSVVRFLVVNMGLYISQVNLFRFDSFDSFFQIVKIFGILIQSQALFLWMGMGSQTVAHVEGLEERKLHNVRFSRY